MQLLVYAKEDDENGKRLIVAVHEALPLRQLQLFRTLSSMQDILRRFVEPESIAVLSAINLAELRQMQILRTLLTEIFVILIVPDSKKSTIRLTHLLLPRFIALQEDSFSDLQEVLIKIVCTPH